MRIYTACTYRVESRIERGSLPSGLDCRKIPQHVCQESQDTVEDKRAIDYALQNRQGSMAVLRRGQERPLRRGQERPLRRGQERPLRREGSKRGGKATWRG